MKCRWCEYTVPAAEVTPINLRWAIDRLRTHVRYTHPAEYRRFNAKRYQYNAARYDELRRREE